MTTTTEAQVREGIERWAETSTPLTEVERPGVLDQDTGVLANRVEHGDIVAQVAADQHRRKVQLVMGVLHQECTILCQDKSQAPDRLEDHRITASVIVMALFPPTPWEDR